MTKNKRSCARVNPGLWMRFKELRQKLGEPEATPDQWTSPAVSAWIDVRKPKEPNPYASLTR